MANEKTTGKDGIVKEALDGFEECVERETHNRTPALDDLKFGRLSEQWPANIRAEREAAGKPCLTINRLPSFIRQVVNDIRQNSPAIMVHPADSKADPKTAEIINGLIRNIEATSDADVAYDTAAEFAASIGFGYFRINLAYSDDDTFDQDILVRAINNPFSVYGDPYDTGHDSANWNIAFVVDTMSKDQFEKKYPGAQNTAWTGGAWQQCKAPWVNGGDIQVAEYWKREQIERKIVALSDGTVVDLDIYEANKANFDADELTVVGSPRAVRSHKVTQYVLNGVEVLEQIEWAGKYIPLVPVYGESINVEGKRYLRSLIRDAKDPQQMFNYWRTCATELVALAPKAPYIGPEGAFENDPRWETANTKAHPYLEYAGTVAPQRQAFAGVPAGALQEALNSSDDMKAIMGLYDPSLGAKSNETSGRAIIARQREGDVSNFHFSDNLSRGIRHGGRIIIDLIPKVYSTPRMVRILGLDGKPMSVPINQHVVIPPQQQGQPQQPPQPLNLPEGQTVPDELSELVHVFDLTIGKYDLTVETGPSYTTQREQAADQMMELLRQFPQAAPYIGDLIAKNLDWPGAEEIAQRLQMLTAHMGLGGAGGSPQAQPGQPGQPGQGGGLPPEAVQMFQRLQQQITMLSAQNQSLQADRSVDQQNAQTKAFDAWTKRMKVINDAQKPSHLPAASPMGPAGPQQ